MKTREIQEEALACAREFPVVSIYGPRQSGKTTLARMCFPDKPWLSFESPDILKRAREDPRGLLRGFGREGAILDEIQRAPEILSYLQEEVDRNDIPGRFILTGSHQVSLKRGVSQTLAGRTTVLTLLPFTTEEIRQDDPACMPDVFDLIFRGSYPRLHERGMRPSRYYASYVAT
jgi:predicted AAA+ superfamily ATPase